MADDMRVPVGWRYASIGELESEGVIAEIQDGNHGERHPKSADYVPSGVPFVMAKDLKDGRLDLEDCSFIPRALADSLRIGFAKPRDVLLTHKATMGRVAIVPDSFDYVMLTPQVTYYRVGDEKRLSHTYLKYAFLGPDFQHQLNSDSDQSTRKYIGVMAQRRLRIPYPPPDEQRAIAHILGMLDDKIELNRQMNQTLEAMARALFQSWFVDFDPVRAKAESRDPALPKHLADLFPDRLEDSELGEIPKGWRVKALGDVTQYLNRGISPAYTEVGGVLVLNQKCVRNGHVDTGQGRRHDPTKRSIEGRRLITGDVLVNSTGVGTLGRVAQLIAIDEETIVDSHVTVVRVDEKEMSWNYLGIDLLRREDEIEALGEGSTGQTELARMHLANLAVIVPEPEIIGMFDGMVLPLRQKVTLNNRISHTLASLRDTLLPKLISGELRVKDAERFIGRAHA
jgi:type I restriction enzyme S subunit